LILAQQLFENHEGNLSDKQIKFAKTIHSCGDDLIQLINDILDLSKIESGVISADIMPVSFREIASFVETTFKPISEAKNLNFKIEIDEKLPETMETDIQRLNQILKNLLSNAFKFTEKGEVRLKIYKPVDVKLNHVGNTEPVIAFSIEDTGIGIPMNTQGLIFEAFQQAEGSTSRKYGGTGLGLSISKGFAELLNGTITVESELGKGSRFTLQLPLKYKLGTKLLGENPLKQMTITAPIKALLPEVEDLAIDDDRHNIVNGDKVLLVIEDDIRFTKIMIDKAHDFGLKVVVAVTYLDIFERIHTYNPIAITLDVNMPESNGWKILKILKNDLTLRHIPVHLISGEDNKALALKFGAKSFHLKPMSNRSLDELISAIVNFNEKNNSKILVIQDDKKELEDISKLLGNYQIDTTSSSTVKKALTNLNNEDFDCIIFDFHMTDAKLMVSQLSDQKYQDSSLIIYSHKEIPATELIQLKRLNHKVVIKSADSQWQLLEEISTLLHLDSKILSAEHINLIEKSRDTADVLDGCKVLVVDDDVRNLFALTAAFERSKLDVITAESGREALEILNNDPEIDIVLMDIMMPEMDGYETIQWIRKENKNKNLPIIAVTAKAMIGDRQKCIASGASDYITKPVKTDQLLSLMRVWLFN
jgi:CheY-like chemotaxis protein/two-component sensor histidine kinase